jgi:hypothetical protein
MAQLSINFDAGISECYHTCREYVAARVHQIGRQQKAIAADLDLSPSHLSRKLAQSPTDTMRFTLDDLERYIETTGDTKPIEYLIEKYLAGQSSEIERLRARLAELEGQHKPRKVV